jgi:uncharacterized integral membrane protein
VPPVAPPVAAGSTVPQPRPPVLPPEDHPSTFQPMLWVKLGLLALVVAYVVAFVVKNTRAIPIHFVFASTKISLIWEILLLLVIGIVGGVLLSQLYRSRARDALKRRGKPRNARPDLVKRDEAVGKPR